MKVHAYILNGIALVALLLIATSAQAQSVNIWRGGESGFGWNDPYKWSLKHTPSGYEAVHFREESSVININSTVQLNNGIHLYGAELSLQGNGNLNLWNPVTHQRTVNIPASIAGFANLTLNDNLSLNGRIALSSRSFGTAASKGSITLKDRSSVTGALSIGNKGTGTGQVFVKGNSSYRITKLEITTKSQDGGAAEIYIFGGTVRIETKENPFEAFLEDSSRKIILGDAGTLRIEHNLPVYRKKDALKLMIQQDHLVAAPGCRLTPPIIHDKRVIIRAEDERNGSNIKTKKELIAAINRIPNRSTSTAFYRNDVQPKKLESLLKNIGSNVGKVEITEPKAPKLEKVIDTIPEKNPSWLAGYIAIFVSVLLLLLRSLRSQKNKKSTSV